MGNENEKDSHETFETSTLKLYKSFAGIQDLI